MTLLKIARLEGQESFSVSGKTERGEVRLPWEEVLWLLTKCSIAVVT